MTNSAFKAKLTRSTLATARDQASAARKLARTVSYDLGWSKAVRNGAIIVGADDAASLGAWVEKLEIEVDADKAGATLRLAADSNGAQDAVFVFYLKNDDGGALEKTKMTSLESDGDWRVHEAKLSKTDVLKLKLWSTLCVEMLDRDPTVLEFKTEAITRALAGSFDCKA